MADNFNSSTGTPMPQDIFQLIPDLPDAAQKYRQLVVKSNNAVNWTPKVTQEVQNAAVWDINSGGRHTPMHKPTPGYISCPLWQETAQILTTFKSPRTFNWEAMDLSPAEKEQLTIIERLLLESRAMLILWTQMNPNWSNSDWYEKVSRSVNSSFQAPTPKPKPAEDSLPMAATPLDHSFRQFFGQELPEQTGTPYDVEPVMKILVENMMEMREVSTTSSADDVPDDDAGSGPAHQNVENKVIGSRAIDPNASEHGIDDSQAMEVDDVVLVNQDLEPAVVGQPVHNDRIKNHDEVPGASGQAGHPASNEGLERVRNSLCPVNDPEEMVVEDDDIIVLEQKSKASETGNHEKSELQKAVAADDKASAPGTAENRERSNRNEEIVSKAQAIVDQNLEPILVDLTSDDEDVPDVQMLPDTPDSGSSGFRSGSSTQNSKSSTPDRSSSTSTQGSSGQPRLDLLNKDPVRNQSIRARNARNAALQVVKPIITTDSPEYRQKLEDFDQYCKEAPVFKEEKLKDLRYFLSAYMLFPGEPHQPFPRWKVICPPAPKMLRSEWNVMKNIVADKRFEQIERNDPEFVMWLDLVGLVQTEVVRQIEEGLITGQGRRRTLAPNSRKRAAPRNNKQEAYAPFKITTSELPVQGLPIYAPSNQNGPSTSSSTAPMPSGPNAESSAFS